VAASGSVVKPVLPYDAMKPLLSEVRKAKEIGRANTIDEKSISKRRQMAPGRVTLWPIHPVLSICAAHGRR